VGIEKKNVVFIKKKQSFSSDKKFFFVSAEGKEAKVVVPYIYYGV
jgi:hypothetical protein